MQISNFSGRQNRTSGSRIPALVLGVLILLSVPVKPPESWAQLANPEQEFIFAQKLYDDNLLKLAAEQFREFVKKFPNDPRADSALFLSGESYFQLSDFKAAFDRYKELEISYPRSAHLAQGQFRMAQCQEELGDFLSAAHLYRSFQLSHPTEARAPEALLRAGKALLRAGRPNKALSAFRDVTRLYPDSPERMAAHLEIIKLHESAGRYDDALNEIDAVFRAFGPEPNDVRVHLLRAQILERMGEFDAAEKAYQQIILKHDGSAASAAALFRLGKLSQARGDLDAAGQFYDKFLDASHDPELRAKAYLGRGDIFLLQEEFAQALESYKSAAAENVPGLRQAIRSKLASAALRLGDLETAIAQLSALVSEARLDSSATSSDKRRVEQAYVDLVDALLQAGRGNEALQVIARYGHAFPDGERQADLAFRRARIFDQSLHDYSRALRAYDEFQEKFSTSPLVDESQMRLARCYEKLGEFSVALKEYARYERRYPAGDEIEEVKLRRRLIAATVPLEPQSGIERIGKLLQGLGETNRAESRALQWGKLYLDVKDFVAAERQFKQILAHADTLDAALKQEAYFELGRTFFKLAQQAELQGQREKQHAFLDSARVSLAFVKDSLETPEIREEALWLLAQIDASQEENAQASYARLLQSLQTWPQAFSPAKHLDYVLIRLARAVLSDTTETPQKLREAQTYCERLVNEYPDSPFAAEASFRRATAFHRLGQDSTALAAFSAFVDAYPASRFLPEALLLRARLLKKSGDWEAATRDLEAVRSRFFYSRFAARAQRELADLHYEHGDFQSAVHDYETYLKRHSAEAGLGTSQTAALWFRLAQAYEHLHDDRRALATYVRVIFQAKERKMVDEARLAVARIAQRRGETSFAKAY
ncbi:MAG: outer membrane protein assembly factor BamD [Calditrichaeota bacterium]|nr:MAG: outer membrane protein assembly factor BamD [Calditrichota bacterium]